MWSGVEGANPSRCRRNGRIRSLLCMCERIQPRKWTSCSEWWTRMLAKNQTNPFHSETGTFLPHSSNSQDSRTVRITPYTTGMWPSVTITGRTRPLPPFNRQSQLPLPNPTTTDSTVVNSSMSPYPLGGGWPGLPRVKGIF